MSIKFRDDHSRPERSKMVRVVIPAPNEPLHIVIGHNPIYWRTVSMHYDVSLGRQVPCLNEVCPYCPQPTRETTYVPVLLARGASPGGRFAPRIVPVTDGWSEILDADLSANVFKITRAAKSQACRWSVACPLATYNLSPYIGQVIEDSLYRMWGVKK